jgi:pimeloyl-ACP methyl ester carboxylesterase
MKAHKALTSGQARVDSHTLGDGAHMRVRIAGSGRPVLLVHGWAMSGEAFGPQMALARHGLQVIAPDLRGFGDSELGAAPLGIAAMVEDLADLVAHLDLHDAIAIGWSMGASLVWELLARPDMAARFAGVISIDMTPRVRNGEGWTLGLANGHDAAATARALEAMVLDWPAYCASFVPRITHAPPTADPALLALLSRLATATNPRTAAQAWAALSAHDARAALSAIDMPALVTHGAHSQLYSAEVARFTVDALPNGRLHTFAHSGHAPHLEEPDDFNALIIRFAHGLNHHDPARQAAPTTP